MSSKLHKLTQRAAHIVRIIDEVDAKTARRLDRELLQIERQIARAEKQIRREVA